MSHEMQRIPRVAFRYMQLTQEVLYKFLVQKLIVATFEWEERHVGSSARSPRNKAELELIGRTENRWETAGVWGLSANVPIIQTLLAELEVIWLEKETIIHSSPPFFPSDHKESVSHLQASAVIQQERQKQ